MQYTIRYLIVLENYTIVSYHRHKYPSRSKSYFLSFENLGINRETEPHPGKTNVIFIQTKKDDPQVVFFVSHSYDRT